MNMQFFNDGVYPCDTYEHAYYARVYDAEALKHLRELCENDMFILNSEIAKNEWPKDFYRERSGNWMHCKSMIEECILTAQIITEWEEKNKD